MGSEHVDTPAWVREAVFYQIFPDRFASSTRVAKPGEVEAWDAPPTVHGFKGGDLLGIVEHLDDLQHLGVTALYLTPIFASASNHRYHTDDYLAVDPLLGGDAALRELLDAAHARGMRVMLDGVFNHSGRGFWPFHHVAEAGGSSPYRDWFHLDTEGMARGRSLRPYPDAAEMAEIAHLVEGGVLVGEASRRVLGYEGWWGLPALPKLAVTNPDTRSFLLGIAEHWLRFGIDGWRLDVAEEIGGDFWEEFRTRVRAVNPEAYLVAEIWHHKPEWLDGHHFDAFMNYPLAEAIIGYAAGRHLDERVVAEHVEYRDTVVPRDGASFAAELQRLLGVYDPAVIAVMLNLLGSHDAPRVLTACRDDMASVRLATLLQMTLPGAPCIYYGDEVGMAGHQDPDNRRAYPRDDAGKDLVLRDMVRDTIWLRRRHRALRDGGFRVLGTSGGALAYLRTDERHAFVVACNAGEEAVELSLEVAEAAGEPVLERLGSADPTPAGGAGWQPDATSRTLVVSVPARTGMVVRLDVAGG